MTDTTLAFHGFRAQIVALIETHVPAAALPAALVVLAPIVANLESAVRASLGSPMADEEVYDRALAAAMQFTEVYVFTHPAEARNAAVAQIKESFGFYCDAVWDDETALNEARKQAAGVPVPGSVAEVVSAGTPSPATSGKAAKGKKSKAAAHPLSAASDTAG